MTKEHEIREILPGEGLGIIKFGMTRDQLKLILGAPDEIDTDYTDGIEDEDIETWHYDKLDLSVQFSESTDFRLISIASGAEYVELEGQNLIGVDKESLEEFLKELQIDTLIKESVTDEDGEESDILIVPDLEMNFWMEDDIISEIQWVPFLEEDEESICWPEVTQDPQ